MKNILLLFVCIFILYPAFAQKRCIYPACEVDFLKNKLYIVQTGQFRFDSALKVAVTEEWTVSPVGGYITKTAFDAMKRLEGNSFLEPAKYNWYIPKSPSEREEHGACVLNFFEGHTVYPSAYINYESIDLLEGYPADTFDATIYRLKLIIRGRNNYYKDHSTKNISHKSNELSVLKRKILLINEKDIHNADSTNNLYEPDAFAQYHYKIEMSTAKKIEAIIQSKDSNYVLAVRLVSDLGSGVFLFNVATGVSLGNLRTKDSPSAICIKDVEVLEQKISE